MAKQIRKPRAKQQVDLDRDGIFSEAMQLHAHADPLPLHYERAAEAMGLASASDVPQCASVAELVALVMGVHAVSGNEKAIQAFIERFSPKSAPKQAVEVTTNSSAAPNKSKTDAERDTAKDYMDSLH